MAGNPHPQTSGSDSPSVGYDPTRPGTAQNSPHDTDRDASPLMPYSRSSAVTSRSDSILSTDATGTALPFKETPGKESPAMSTDDDLFTRFGIDRNSDLVQAYRTRTDTQGRLYDLRQDTGLSQKKFARKIGVSTRDVQLAELADFDSLTIDALQRYAAALGQTITLTHIPGCSAAKIVVNADQDAE